MKSAMFKKVLGATGIALLALSTSGCATTKVTQANPAATNCEDISNPESWQDGWTYGLTDWKENSKMYTGFGLFKCAEVATLTVKFESLGEKLQTGHSYLSYGEDQITMVNAPQPTTKWFKGDLISAIPNGQVKVESGKTFQPVSEVLSKNLRADQKNEPVQAVVTLQAEGKKPITFVKKIVLTLPVHHSM